MTRLEQIRGWVKKYELGYYFNPGGVEFFSSNNRSIPHCQVSEFVDCEDGVYRDDKGFERLKEWVKIYFENWESNLKT